MNMNKMAKFLKKLREDRGLTQEQLGEIQPGSYQRKYRPDLPYQKIPVLEQIFDDQHQNQKSDR